MVANILRSFGPENFSNEFYIFKPFEEKVLQFLQSWNEWFKPGFMWKFVSNRSFHDNRGTHDDKVKITYIRVPL